MRGKELIFKNKLQDELDVSRETMSRLEAYEASLKKWNLKINLVARSTVNDIWERHFLDSAQVFSMLPAEAATVYDFGSGAGFPGLVVSVLAKEKMPLLRVKLVESDLRKAAFLSAVARDLDLNVTVCAERVENLKGPRAEVVMARALAPLSDLLQMAFMHMSKDGQAMFLKGLRHLEELDTAMSMWDFDVEKKKSWTSPGSSLLIIKNLRQK